MKTPRLSLLAPGLAAGMHLVQGAPRRVMLFPDGATFLHLNEVGLKFFAAAILWAAGAGAK